MRRFLSILGASVLTMAFVRPIPGPLPDVACEDAAEEASERTLDTAAAGQSGLRIFVDPETGELVAEPTEEQLERLRSRVSEKLRRRGSAWDLGQFDLRGGGQGVFLDGWADHELVVRRADDGSLRSVCSQGDSHAGEPAEEDR